MQVRKIPQATAYCHSSRADYTPEQLAFLKAVGEFRRRHGRVPTDRETFAIAWSLGYRRVTP